jgi:hypothetical protein
MYGLLADSHTLNRWKNYFSQLLKVHEVNSIWQTGIHRTEPVVPEQSPFFVEIVIETFKQYKLPGIDHISAEVIQVGDEKLCSEIHNLIHSIWNNEELHQQWEESIIIPLYKNSDRINCSNY